MTQRIKINGYIDHAALANQAVSIAGMREAIQQGESLSDIAAIAQVHATLALVEQQRIANLIALGQFTVTPGHMPIFRHVVFDMETGEGISPEIRKGLGL